MAIRIGNKNLRSLPGFKRVMVGNVQVWPEYDPSLYLEIEPTILWMTDYGTNDVISNTTWKVK